VSAAIKSAVTAMAVMRRSTFSLHYVRYRTDELKLVPVLTKLAN
jgi:hypothetical protein